MSAVQSDPSRHAALTAAEAPAPGQVVAGKYQLVRELGAGGMGVVWVAHDQVLDVHVAIKLIDLERAPNPKRVAERVLQEARAAARLAHPAICRVFEFGETEAGNPYIVSELLHGETLAEVLTTSPRLAATRAVRMLLPVIEGLVMAHGRGVVHRDVKPENIFLSRDEVSRMRPKLLDFGIARMVDANRKITIDGTLLGTPDYMSPEQARGEGDIDARTDVWAVSVVLYEAIAGQRPFDGDNYNALLWAICQAEPTALTDLGAGDPGLWAVIKRGLAKERDDRWASMRDLGTALAEWLLTQGVKEDICGFALRSTWLAENGRVALSTAPPPSSANVLAPYLPSAERSPFELGDVTVPPPTRPLTGVFPKPVSSAWRRQLYVGVGLAGAACLLAVSWLAVRAAASGRGAPPEPQVASAVVAVPAPPRASAPATSVAPAVAVAAASVAPVASSTSAPSAAPARQPQRQDRRKLDPDSYDFGF